MVGHEHAGRMTLTLTDRLHGCHKRITNMCMAAQCWDDAAYNEQDNGLNTQPMNHKGMIDAWFQWVPVSSF